VEADVRHAFAIEPSERSGIRRTSNSIKPLRRSFTRVSRSLSLGAASSAASPARSRLQVRQKFPSAELTQLSGSGAGRPSIRLAETPHSSQVHLRAEGA
jgi:hypothetical protein